jgi:hypothetical protein
MRTGPHRLKGEKLPFQEERLVQVTLSQRYVFGLDEFRPADFSGRTFGPKNFFLLQNRITLTLIFISHRAEIPYSHVFAHFALIVTLKWNLVES